MNVIHSELLKKFQAYYPLLNIGSVISYDATSGTFLDTGGDKIDKRFAKFTPTNIIGGVVPSAFIDEGMSINDAIEKALSYTSLKALKGVDYDIGGVVTFSGALEVRQTVTFSVNSSVFTGSFIVKFYNNARSGFNGVIPRDFTGKVPLSTFSRIQAFCLANVFTQDIAVLQNGYMAATWVDNLITRLSSAGIDTTGVRDSLIGTIAYKLYSDTYSDLLDIPFGEKILTIRYQGSRVSAPFLSYVELPTI